MMQRLYDEHGQYITNKSYTEILRLDKLLTEANIPHTLRKFMDGWQVCYPQEEKRVMDAVQHFGSYGHENNLLEIMGLVDQFDECRDSVLGHLTADDVFSRIKKHFDAKGAV